MGVFRYLGLRMKSEWAICKASTAHTAAKRCRKRVVSGSHRKPNGGHWRWGKLPSWRCFLGFVDPFLSRFPEDFREANERSIQMASRRFWEICKIMANLPWDAEGFVHNGCLGWHASSSVTQKMGTVSIFGRDSGQVCWMLHCTASWEVQGCCKWGCKWFTALPIQRQLSGFCPGGGSAL